MESNDSSSQDNSIKSINVVKTICDFPSIKTISSSLGSTQTAPQTSIKTWYLRRRQSKTFPQPRARAYVGFYLVDRYRGMKRAENEQTKSPSSDGNLCEHVKQKLFLSLNE